MIIVEGLSDVTHPTLGAVDDLVVSVHWATENQQHTSGLDFLTYATARPILFRTTVDSLGLPYYGEVTIFPVMADSSISQETQVRVLMHELCHIMGFTDQYIEYAVGTETINGVRYFNGIGAAEGYKLLLYYGLGEKLSYAIPGLRVPMMNDSPHWRFPTLNWELMSPFANVLSEKAYVTGVTMLAMRDLGYVVDTSMNETPPFQNAATKLAIGSHFNCDGETVHGVGP